MQTLFIIYHEDLEAQVHAVLARGMVLARYTRIDNVVGARMAQIEAETGYMADRNNRIILVVAEKEMISRLVVDFRSLRSREGHGLRGFVTDALNVF